MDQGSTFWINRTKRAPLGFWPPSAPLISIGVNWTAVYRGISIQRLGPPTVRVNPETWHKEARASRALDGLLGSPKR